MAKLTKYFFDTISRTKNAVITLITTNTCYAHGVGRVVGALGSEVGFAGSMLNKIISMMHALHYHKNPKLQLSGIK